MPDTELPTRPLALIAADLPGQSAILERSTKSLAMLYGPWGLGKTFVALGIA